MKKAVSITLSVLLTLFCLPLGARAAVSTGTVIDPDGSDGYSGDYVVIYNPSVSASDTASTGAMTGLIETEVGNKRPACKGDPVVPYMIDVDPMLAELDRAHLAGLPETEEMPTKASFEVGDTHKFMIRNYSPDGLYMTFKVLAKGEHCYVWTPVSTNANVYPLDSIDPDYARMAADMFDSKFDLMRESFGEHSNGAHGDGRLSILYYNINDGWQPGQAYIGGYFSASDLYYNGLPILNIDTYPGVIRPDANGVMVSDISNTYSPTVHEYQHLICYSRVGSADTWIDECMSSAAEEICFPGSCVYRRIQTWTHHDYSEHQDWDAPPCEVEYAAENSAENGYSLYDWSNGMTGGDMLVLYAQVSLFAQYMYSRFGNTVFHRIIDNMGGSSPANSFQSVCRAATGVDPDELAQNFRIALTANTSPYEYGGLYSFSMQEGYDPAAYHGVENLYELLCPVVFTGASCLIRGGGAICVKPVGGVYYPPQDASPDLRYFGVTRSFDGPGYQLGDVDMNGGVNSADALLALRYAMGLTALTPGQLGLGDMDGDGSVTSSDALIIIRISLGAVSKGEKHYVQIFRR